jgi:hypothetical protein
MLARRVLAAAISVAVVGAVALLILPEHPARCPLVVNVVSLEPAEIYDDTGAELWYANLSVSNSDARPRRPENGLYVKNGDSAMELKVANRWMEVEGGLACKLDPQDKCTRLFLLPAGTESCRVCLEYAGAVFIKGRRAWFAERLPGWIRFRLSYKFRKWAGLSQYGPSSHWREITVELPLPPKKSKS